MTVSGRCGTPHRPETILKPCALAAPGSKFLSIQTQLVPIEDAIRRHERKQRFLPRLSMGCATLASIETFPGMNPTRFLPGQRRHSSFNGQPHRALNHLMGQGLTLPVRSGTDNVVDHLRNSADPVADRMDRFPCDWLVHSPSARGRCCGAVDPAHLGQTRGLTPSSSSPPPSAQACAAPPALRSFFCARRKAAKRRFALHCASLPANALGRSSRGRLARAWIHPLRDVAQQAICVAFLLDGLVHSTTASHQSP